MCCTYLEEMLHRVRLLISYVYPHYPHNYTRAEEPPRMRKHEKGNSHGLLRCGFTSFTSYQVPVIAYR